MSGTDKRLDPALQGHRVTRAALALLIALALPAPIKRTLYAEAIVVSVSDPSSAGSESTIRGMGVALKDTEGVMGELNKLIEAARPGPAPESEPED